MKKFITFFVCLLIFSSARILAQEFTAATYWKMENDPAYTMILERQNSGKYLTAEELKFIADYKLKLDNYFARMSDNEKANYFKNRAQWSQKPESLNTLPVQQDQEVYSGERSMYSQYLFQSGIFGFFYGLSFDYLLGINDAGAAAAIPLLSAGTSVLFPMLSLKDKYVTYNSLKLSLHGKGIGALQGAAFGVLLTGDNVEDGKLILGIATASSIALGHVGFYLGRQKQWSQGRVALYSHYGWLMPLTGMAIDAALQVEDPRIYGATSLAFGAGGYLIADRVANWNDFTKGDVIATQTFATLNTLLGFCIMSDIEANASELDPATLLIPAVGALGGTLLGHVWLKDARLSNQQGRNTALATAGGAVIGVGLVALFSPESAAPYYLLGYATGLTTYAVLIHKYKEANTITLTHFEKPGKWNVNFSPQNIFLNNQLARYSVRNTGRMNMLPAISASVTF